MTSDNRQVIPTILAKTAKLAISTALSTSASLKMTSGDFPPNSRVTLLMFDLPADDCMIFPTSVDPVNDILSTSGDSTIAAPAVGPYPGITLTTPAGNPASCIRDARNSDVSGVCSAGCDVIFN